MPVIIDYRPRRRERLTPMEARLTGWLGSLSLTDRVSYGYAIQAWLSNGDETLLAPVEDSLQAAGIPRGVVALLGCRLEDE
jgi:hypothetical protein